MIDGVKVIQLKIIPDERGTVMHMLRCDDPHFIEFGEIYFSTVFPDLIKGWHLHKRMILNYAVVQGMIKLVLFDGRVGSPTHGEIMELFIGNLNYCLVQVPPGVWNGFKCLGRDGAIVANCATLPHDPDEIVRLDPFSNQIPYDWNIKHR